MNKASFKVCMEAGVATEAQEAEMTDKQSSQFWKAKALKTQNNPVGVVSETLIQIGKTKIGLFGHNPEGVVNKEAKLEIDLAMFTDLARITGAFKLQFPDREVNLEVLTELRDLLPCFACAGLKNYASEKRSLTCNHR